MVCFHPDLTRDGYRETLKFFSLFQIAHWPLKWLVSRPRRTWGESTVWQSSCPTLPRRTSMCEPTFTEVVVHWVSLEISFQEHSDSKEVEILLNCIQYGGCSWLCSREDISIDRGGREGSRRSRRAMDSVRMWWTFPSPGFRACGSTTPTAKRGRLLRDVAVCQRGTDKVPFWVGEEGERETENRKTQPFYSISFASFEHESTALWRLGAPLKMASDQENPPFQATTLSLMSAPPSNKTG